MISPPSSNNPFMLFPNEKLIFKTNPHWLFLAVPLGLLLSLWFLYLYFICPFMLASIITRICVAIASIAVSFVMLIIYLDWRFNRLYLTNYRLVKERGIIGKRFMSIFLEQVQDITCGYGIIGRLFHYGNLEIESAGTYGRMVFKGIPTPKRMKELIEEQMASLLK